jgi:preprotein translocase SecF subunit
MYSFVKNRFKYYAIAGGLVIFSLISPWIFGLNQGIDMTGGIQIEYKTEGGDDVALEASAREFANELKKSTLIGDKEVMNDVNVYGIAGTTSFIVEAGFRKLDGVSDTDLESAKVAFTKNLNDKLASVKEGKVSQSRYINVGESFGAYIKKSGYVTLTLAILMIAVYIAYAFRGSIPGMASWPFAVVTAVSLAHDVIVAFGLYVLTSYFFPEFKIDTFFMTAMLTILGYSINDTIVVMDRIRSNLEGGEMKRGGLSSIIDKSINDTMTRSILTSSTVFIVLLAMFFFGPESLKGFSLALLFGTIVGTYSSIFIASPLLVDITKKK